MTPFIKQQWTNYSPHDSNYPGSWYKEFPDYNTARNYIGCNLFDEVYGAFSDQTTLLHVIGDENGELCELRLETEYLNDKIRLQMFSYLYTEYYQDNAVYIRIPCESTDCRETIFNTDAGKQYLSFSYSNLESDYLCLDSFLVTNGVLYNLHIAYLEEDSLYAESILHRWANSF